MRTLLVTQRMHPALARRIEASVRGRGVRAERARFGPSLVMLLRFGSLLVLFAAVMSFWLVRRRAEQRFAAARAEFLLEVHARSAGVTAAERRFLGRVERWLERESGAYAGDFVAEELRGVGAFSRVLAWPTVYVRGPLAAFGSVSQTAAAAANSWSDAFTNCLHSPPAARNEKVLLQSLRAGAHASGLLAPEPPRVLRLHDAELGWPFLAPSFAERVRVVEEETELARLRGLFAKAPLAKARAVAKAEVLLFAMDEPGDGTGPIELDGERPHSIRVGLVNLATDTLRLRLRRRVDPQWISAANRAHYATRLDSCALALDVHEAVRGP